ncbi:MAG: hypothetical protein Q8N23_04995 [Archangium sp.]|nr:hypothetical protein [Archangium sp.]MDP3571415.1 hypothetical protein [Archangium sp.]
MRTLLVAALVCSTSALAGEPVAMFIPKAINLEAGQVESFGLVCAGHYARVNESVVISPTQAQAAVGENGSLLEAAKSLEARELVELTLIELSSQRGPGRLLISATRRGLDGKEIHSAEFTAGSIDDAPAVCERIALSLTQKLTAKETLNRHNVTAAEARLSGKPHRIGSERVIGVKTGFLGAFSADTTVNPLGSIAFNARLEQERFFIEFGVGALIPAVVNASSTSYGGITAEVGASYYLTDGDVSPYLGAGVQPRIVFGGSVFNLAPYAQAGLMLARQSSTRIYFDLRVAQNVLPVSNGFSMASGVYPTELTGAVGIGW